MADWYVSEVKQMIYIAVLSNREIQQYSPCSLDPCMAATKLAR